MTEDRMEWARSVWGEIFELGCKRGILSFLRHSGLIVPGDTSRFPCLNDWKTLRVRHAASHALEQLGLSLPADGELAKAAEADAAHLLNSGYGIGWTAMRGLARDTWSHQLRDGEARIEALWGFPTLSVWGGTPDEKFARRQANLAVSSEMFPKSFQFDLERVEAHGSKGEPVNADFLLSVLGRKQRWLTVFEFSLNSPSGVRDMRDVNGHENEVRSYVRFQRVRGVFSDIAAESDGSPLILNSGISEHMPGMTSKDKPLYKLMQACSYLTQIAPAFPNPGDKGTTIHAVAVTGAGCEAISSHASKLDGTSLKIGEPGVDGRLLLMRAMGKTYRDNGWNETGEGYQAKRAEQRKQLIGVALNALPHSISESLAPVLSGGDTHAVASEVLQNVPHPTVPFSIDSAMHWLEDTASEGVLRRIGETSESLFIAARDGASEDMCTLRGLNATVINAIIRNAPVGELTVAGLLGMPGIGKTHATIGTFGHIVAEGQGGFLYYASPRVVINADVASKVKVRFPEGSVCLTTDAALMEAGPAWAREIGLQPPRNAAWFSGAIRMDIAGRQEPSNISGGILRLDTEDAQKAVESNTLVRRSGSRDVEQGDREVNDPSQPGIIGTLASEARQIITQNPDVKVVTLLSSIQAFKSTGFGNTIDRLSKLFAHRPDTMQGLDERRALAQRMPLFVFMVDEITGDGAGVPLCHALADWMRRELINPFADEPDGSPFRCVLLLADASLSTPDVFHSQMSAGEIGAGQSPPRVILGDGEACFPFWLQETKIKLGNCITNVINVMVNGYPSTSLSIGYDVSLETLSWSGDPAKSDMALIKAQHGDKLLLRAVNRVKAAILQSPEGQCILFAENRGFLSDLRLSLLDDGFALGEVEIIDSKVPLARKRMLLEEVNRDKVRVWLMTSAGARGVSFPLACNIIVQFPRFSIEAELMEMAQAIYRGRGFTSSAPGRGDVDGNMLARHILLVVDDYIIDDKKFGDVPMEERRDSKALDMANFIALARATIQTRIFGRCERGIKGTVVPLGGVGTEAISGMMSTCLRNFSQECNAAIRDKTSSSRLASAALTAAMVMFGPGRAIALRPSGFISLATDSGQATRMRQILESPSAPMFDASVELPGLPEHAWQIGPLIFEKWDAVDTDEVFMFEDRESDERASLVAQLHVLVREFSSSDGLKRSSRELLDVLRRDNADNESKSYRARKRMEKSSLWCVGLADHSRFMAPDDHEGGRPGAECLVEGWRNMLAMAAQSARRADNVFPYLSGYAQAPFVLLNSAGDPTGMERVFRSRTVMVSREMNVLSAIIRPVIYQM